MLAPKKVKHRKWFTGDASGIATAGVRVSFGQWGLKSLDTKWVTARQIEAARRAMTHYLKRGGKIWIRIFPDKPVTTKSAEVPMGGGKGAVDHYVAVVKAGMVMFEIDGIPADQAREALRLAGHKLSVRTRIVGK
ncbi:50S ribosomal protein L16 [Candidatus Falkowbacteria bacterium]|nr:50S ribosomal protein L16 [Candidatus Falkowbacteria bacterium]